MRKSRLLPLLAVVPLALAAAPSGSQDAPETATSEVESASTETSSQDTTTQNDPTTQDTNQDSNTASSTSSGGNSSSEATAAEVEGLLELSHTKADTRDGGSAEGQPVRIGDQTVIGGEQKGEGETSGDAFSTGETELGSLALAPYSAKVDGEGNSEGHSDVATATVIDSETVALELLSSDSKATKDGANSKTSGARLNLGGDQLEVVLLHSETSSEGDGGSYVLAINGEKVLSDEQVGGQCNIDAQPLLTLLCAYAEESAAGDFAENTAAGVAKLTALEDNVKANVFTASAGESPSQGAVLPAAEPAGDREPQAAPADDGGPLAFTGFGALGLGLLGLGALGSGVAIRRFTRDDS